LGLHLFGKELVVPIDLNRTGGVPTFEGFECDYLIIGISRDVIGVDVLEGPAGLYGVGL